MILLYALDPLRILYLSIGCILLLLLIFIVFFIVNFKKNQNELLLKSELEQERHQNELLLKNYENLINLRKERERISEDIHDDIGSILSAIKLQAQFVKARVQDATVIESLDSIAEHTQIATTNFRELIWCLHSRNDTMSEFISYAEQLAKNIMTPSSIALDIDKGHIYDDVIMNSFQRRQLILTLKEILHNAIKHSNATKMRLAFQMDDHVFKLFAEDNGLGFDLDKKRNGLYHIEKRIHSIHGHLFLDSSDTGTKYRIELDLI